ncbi:MAG: fumarylacetoacetate hydrolase family protein [Deltaproteobacteria bacterium]|nr:fumarylacetoacetate hydrolase family protein [Deltaproteobacteria bacterium]
MKLLNFQDVSGGTPKFGVVIKGYALSFETLQYKSGQTCDELTDVYSYLEHLPSSEDTARELLKYGDAYIASFNDDEKVPLEKARILPPIASPRALIDFGLTPRHLGNSAATLIKHEFGAIIGSIISPFIKKRMLAAAGGKMLYYKCNHNAVIGDNDTIHWPVYSSYLDIEPELAVVTGNEVRPIAGYTIFNDSSARDVQFWEMIGTGPARSKDFGHSKGLGPFLVTTDEIGDPLALNVKVKIGERFEWKGSTSEYSASPEKAIEYLKTVFIPPPGTVIGLGTIPDCTGLDNDLWINPGEKIEITFDKLGTLRQNTPEILGKIEPSRWGNREDLSKFY